MNTLLHFGPSDFVSAYDIGLADALESATQGMPSDVVCREVSLKDFAKEAWHIVEPATEFIDNWHIDAICDHLEAVYTGDIEQLIISMPPRHMKSLLVAVMWPCWVWTKNPGFKWIFASYAQTLSTRDSVKCRSILQSPWYSKHWGELFKLKRDENLKTKFTNTREGYRIATSVDGSATGEGGDCIVGDDLLKAKDAYSDVARATANTFWNETMHTRINNPKKPKKVLMAQRLHETDVSGVVLKEKGKTYVHLCLPAEYDPLALASLPEALPTPLDFVDPRKDLPVGEVLWKDRYPQEVLEKTKEALGPWAYASQMQQTPAPADGGIFKKNWWQYYTHATLPSTFDAVFMSWDMSFKKTTEGSYVVGQVWGKDGPSFYLLDQVRGRWDFVDSKLQFEKLCEKWPEAFAKYVEEKANGAAIISALHNTINGLIPIIPKGTKEARAHAIAPAVRSGNVYLPSEDAYGYGWVDAFVSECTSFPKGANDDQVDCLTQALSEYISDPVARLRIH